MPPVRENEFALNEPNVTGLKGIKLHLSPSITANETGQEEKIFTDRAY